MVCNNPIGLLLNLITFCVIQNHFYLRLHSFGLFFFFCFLSKVLMYFSNIFCGTPKQHLTIRFKNDKRNTTFFFHFASSSSVQAISWTFFLPSENWLSKKIFTVISFYWTRRIRMFLLYCQKLVCVIAFILWSSFPRIFWWWCFLAMLMSCVKITNVIKILQMLMMMLLNMVLWCGKHTREI